MDVRFDPSWVAEDWLVLRFDLLWGVRSYLDGGDWLADFASSCQPAVAFASSLGVELVRV